ncbi:hypothetical protein [Asaia astilbis]|uniref:hypothetical protein n=1 Tax=Asaia astilbis TaxID=610244 RepID=UPI00046FAA56|nr:hypothetical protein [Asaia astilbis]
MRWLALVALLGLSSCSSVQYVPCPVLVTYSKADQAALAAEIKANPNPETVRWIGDYIGLRDQVRACQR